MSRKLPLKKNAHLLGPLGRYINLEGARVWASWAPWDAEKKEPKAGPLGTEVDGIFQEKKVEETKIFRVYYFPCREFGIFFHYDTNAF